MRRVTRSASSASFEKPESVLARRATLRGLTHSRVWSKCKKRASSDRCLGIFVPLSRLLLGGRLSRSSGIGIRSGESRLQDRKEKEEHRMSEHIPKFKDLLALLRAKNSSAARRVDSSPAFQ